jgi:hypothetical protein
VFAIIIFCKLGVHDILEQVQVLVLLRDSIGDQHDETKMVLVDLQGEVQVHVNLVRPGKLVSRVFLLSF